jgi:RimJ/RimL family protein N-acetyltransferase
VLIETERLRLRPLTRDDVDELVALHSQPEVEQFMGTFDQARMIEWVALVQRDYAERGIGRLAIIERDTGQFLGRSGLKYLPEFDETELGWVLHPNGWGRGYATEAGTGCVRWGFDNLDVPHLTAMIAPDNERSIAVAKRIGMTPLRADLLLGDPVTVYSISREQWTHGRERIVQLERHGPAKRIGWS